MSWAILYVHAVCTLLMAGLIWFVQLVHYPLFRAVGAGRFAEYEREHQRRTTWVVAPWMLGEAVTGLAICAWRPEGVVGWVPWLGMIVLIGIWGSTYFVQVPLHARLSSGYDAELARRLVRTNWWRTIGWSVRGVLVTWMLASGG